MPKRLLSLLLSLSLLVVALVAPAGVAAAAGFTWLQTSFTLTAGERIATTRIAATSLVRGMGRVTLEMTLGDVPRGLGVRPVSDCIGQGGGVYQCMGIAELWGGPTTPGTYEVPVTLRFGSFQESATITITVLPGTSSAADSTLTSSTGERRADGLDAHDVTVGVRSAAGVPLGGLSSAQVVQAVGLQVTGARIGAFVEQPGADEAEYGLYRAPVTSTTAGTAQVTAGAQGSPRSLVFTSVYSAADSALSVSDGPRRADGEHAHTVTLDLRNGSGVGLTGLTDAQVRSTADVAVPGASLGAFREVAGGRYEAPVTASTPGAYPVTASAAGSPATVTFVEPAVARPDTAELAAGARDVRLDVLANDSGDALRVVTASLEAAAGAVRVAPDGSHLLLDTAPGFAGRATVRYEVLDAHGFAAASTVSASAYAVPALRDGAARVGVGGTVDVDVQALVLSSDAPAQGDGTFPGLRRPAEVVAASADRGTASVTGGVLTYRAPAGYVGTATVEVTARDDLGQQGSGEVLVTVVAVPVLRDVTREVRYGTELVVTPADLGVVPGLDLVSAEVGSGDVTFEARADGTFRYYAEPGHVGTSAFRVEYADDLGQRATATVRVTAVPPPVVARDDAVDLPSGAVDAALDVLDGDDGDGLRVLGVSDVDPAHGSARPSPDGAALLFTAAEGFVGRTALRYEVGDGFGQRDTALVTVTVFAPPALEGARHRVGVDGTVDVDVQALVVGSVDPPQGAGPLPGLRRSATVTAAEALHGDVELVGAVLAYRATPGFTGTDTVVLTATDDLGQTATGEVEVEVVAPPTLRDVALEVPYGTETVVTEADLGVPPGLELVSVDERAGDVRFERLGDGSFRHHAVARYVGTDSFAVTYADDLGQQATATVTVTVVPPPLVACDDVADVASEVVDVPLDALAGDSGDEPRVVDAVVRQSHGGTARPSPDGQDVLFTAAPGFVGSTVVDYTIEDAVGQRAQATVTVHVYAPPLVHDLTRRIAAEGSIELDVARLVEPPAAAPVARLALPGLRRPAQVTQARARYGSVDLVDGVLTYRAAAGFVGTDTVRLVARDDLGQTGSGEVTLEVVAPPVLRDVRVDAVAGTTSVVTPQDLGVAPGLELVSADAGTGAVVFEVRADGAFEHRAPAGYAGTDAFRVAYADDLGQVAHATVTVAVRPAADAGAPGAGAPGTGDGVLAVTGVAATSVALLALALGLGGRALVGLSRLRREDSDA
ncbi:Ig-like domain-containing protein [Cellulomonas sp. NPDC058312]|uniref:Ig-like domain-containing protein n=1 Tax=Cellulomonas sp. NPDC058312 TaxID=3346441 RepID=UPI0036E8BDC5